MKLIMMPTGGVTRMSMFTPAIIVKAIEMGFALIHHGNQDNMYQDFSFYFIGLIQQCRVESR